MANVTNPLYSLAAKGSFARGSLTFCSHNTRNQARYVPSWPRKHLPHLAANHLLFKESQKYWNWLPDYAKWYWNNCIISQHYANINSPWRAPVKGRNLFFQRAIFRMRKGHRPNMTPYDSGNARIYWDSAPTTYVSD